MPVHDELGQRMKTYESVPKTKLIRRMPVAIRLDGKAFHSFTRGMQKPFDELLTKSMQDTMKYLCENIQGCVLGYTQSDEITLILVDYKKLNTSAWFDNEVQKMVSVSASMATFAFNRAFTKHTMEFCLDKANADNPLKDVYHKAMTKGALFDSRVFNIPKEEVTNLVYWRQLDATRNSIQMVGQANFAHSALQNKSCNQIQDMLHELVGINWNDFPTTQKRGSCCVRNQYITRNDYSAVTQKDIIEYGIHDRTQTPNAWVIDNEIPIFKGDGRKYIEWLVEV